MGASWLIVQPHFDQIGIDHVSVYGQLPDYDTFPANILLGVWLRWDAIHYLNIAKLGYFQLSEGDSTFYPLYPILLRIVAIPLGNEYLLAALAISTVAAIAMLACIYWLGNFYFGEDSGLWSTIALAVYPTALFLIAPFTESLFLALTMGAFIAAYQKRWWLMGLLGFFASLTRGPGLLTTIALAWIAYEQMRKNKPINLIRLLISRGFWLALPILGAFTFLIWRSLEGLPPLGVIHEQYSGFRWITPPIGLFNAIQQWIKVHDLPTTLDLWSIIIFLVLFGLMILRKRWRKPEWLLYMGANLLLFMSKDSFVASSLQSTSRYVLVLFPAFLLIGDWLSRQSKRSLFSYLSISSIFLIVLSACYALWFFVG